ncbi:MAG: hypothetical protein ACYDCN_01590 [Bacteroidia bacterium]
MKVKSILMSMFIMTLTATQAQTKTPATKQTTPTNQCDELKKENEFLKKELDIRTPIKTVSQNDLEIKLVSAKGNIKTQTIKLDFLITNKANIRQFIISRLNQKFVTVEGTLIPITKNYTIDGIDLATDIPIKTTVEIGTILPKNTILKLVSLGYMINAINSIGGDTYTAAFTDIPVEWK